MSTKKSKNPIGGQTKYKSEYCERIVEFFDTRPFEERKIEHYDSKGNVKFTDIKLLPLPMPNLIRFAKSIKVDYTTVYRWTKQHKEFCKAFERARDIRKWVLIDGAIGGVYNPAFAIFTAKNITDMEDKQKLVGDENAPIAVKIVDYAQTKTKIEKPKAEHAGAPSTATV